MELEVVPFRSGFESQVIDLILEIQRNEFDIQITAEEQPDLADISGFYQVGNGNFWLALCGGELIGTIGLLDIAFSQAALRKMFVRRAFRGSGTGAAKSLLGTLIDWSLTHSVGEIFLGTTPHFLAAHRFYEKNGFVELEKASLPTSFPIMEVDTKFYHRRATGSP